MLQEAASRQDRSGKAHHRPPRPRVPISSQASSTGNSPRGHGSTAPPAPSSSSSSQAHRHSKISRSSSAANITSNAGLNADAVCTSLCSKSTEEQIRALKKLRFDLELCRCLAAEERQATPCTHMAFIRQMRPSFLILTQSKNTSAFHADPPAMHQRLVHRRSCLNSLLISGEAMTMLREYIGFTLTQYWVSCS